MSCSVTYSSLPFASQPLYCDTGMQPQQQQQQFMPYVQQPFHPAAAAAFLQQPQQPQYYQCSPMQTQLQLCSSSNSSNSISPLRCDPGYESDSTASGKFQLQGHQQQASPFSSDSARPESPASGTCQDVNQLSDDLKGFCMSDGPRPVDMALSQQMEVVWHERFTDFFCRLRFGTWRLFPVFDPPDLHNTGVPRNQWRYTKDQAKVRFICNTCNKAWTSMAGQVVFWIYKNDRTNEGYVHFKLYGQKCSDCQSDYYEHAIWYQEEVEKVIENLYHHVAHLYYGERQQKRRVDRRAGHPKKEHSSATCQACRENVCRRASRKKQRTDDEQQKQ